MKDVLDYFAFSGDGAFTTHVSDSSSASAALRLTTMKMSMTIRLGSMIAAGVAALAILMTILQRLH